MQIMIFAVSGRDHGRFVSMTRLKPFGAKLLAESWIELGFTDVRISWNGRCCDIAAFGAQSMLMPMNFEQSNLPADIL